MASTIRFATALAVALTTSIQAETREPFRLTDALALAREQNPELAVARARARAAAEVPRRAAAWDDPVVSWEAWNAPEPFDLGRADNNILRLSQKLPFPGKRSLAGAAAERDADMARFDIERASLDVAAAVKHAYWRLWQLESELDVYGRDQELVARYARVAEAKYGVGEAGESDVLRAQVELAHMVNRLTTQRLAADGARAELNSLMSRDPDVTIGALEDPPPPKLEMRVEPLAARALADRPELSAQAAAIAREEAGLRLARYNYLPDFEVSVGRFFNHDQPNGVGAMASVSIPLAYKYKYDAAVSEASAKLSASEAELRRLQDQVRRQVQQALLRARAAASEHALFTTTHIPHAEQALRASEIGYETGKVDFLSLIDSVRAVESIHLEHIRASAEFEEAVADLERAVGGEVARTAEP